jgi:sugar phosphate isomerase/epimerase
MKPCVTISLVPEARGGPFVFWDDLEGSCREAAELGFPAVEIFPPDPDILHTRNVGALLARHQLQLAAVGTGAGWVKHGLTLTDADPARRQAAREFVANVVRRAGELGASAIIGSMQGRHGGTIAREQALDLLADALQELGSLASQFHVPLFYEPLNRYETNLCTTMASGVELLQRAGSPHVRLLADLFHMNVEEVDVAEAIRTAGPHLGHVHFVDSNRRPAGAGHTRFEPILAALRAIDYRGYLSAEALPWPDSIGAARQTLLAFRQWNP